MYAQGRPLLPGRAGAWTRTAVSDDQAQALQGSFAYKSRLMVPSQVLTLPTPDSSGDTHLVVTVLTRV